MKVFIRVILVPPQLVYTPSKSVIKTIEVSVGPWFECYLPILPRDFWKTFAYIEKDLKFRKITWFDALSFTVTTLMRLLRMGILHFGFEREELHWKYWLNSKLTREIWRRQKNWRWHRVGKLWRHWHLFDLWGSWYCKLFILKLHMCM